MRTKPSGTFLNGSVAIRVLAIIGIAGFLMLVAVAAGVASYFRLSSEARSLRDALLSSTSDPWNKKIALNIGGFTTAVARTGLGFVKKLPPEARVAASALRGVEVGIYELADGQRHDDPAGVIARADKAMTAKGWVRMVGVCEKDQLVAIYVPLKDLSARRMKCCVLVLESRQLVVASVRANIEPLMALTTGPLKEKLDTVHLALR
jgi:hypothetical protein